MNTQYNHIYLSDKSEQNLCICKIPYEDLNDAVEGLKIIKDDEFVTIWDGEELQVFAIKA